MWWFYNLLQPAAGQVDTSSFYPWGSGDFQLNRGDSQFASYSVLNNFPFFANLRTTLYIHTNGVLSFNLAMPSFDPTPFPGTAPPKIAPFYADLDTSSAGPSVSPNTANTVYWRPYTGAGCGTPCTMAQSDIRSRTAFFPGFDTFVPDFVLVVTYYGCRYATQPNPSDYWNQVQTFQAILIRGNVSATQQSSFVVFKYPPNGVRWFTPNPSQNNAIIGFDAGDGVRSYMHPNSQSSNINALNGLTLVFRVDGNSMTQGAPLAPVVWSVSPQLLSTDASVGNRNITLIGYNFGSSFLVPTTVTVGINSCPVLNVSSTAVICSLPAGQGFAPVNVLVGTSSMLSLPSWATDMTFYSTAQSATSSSTCLQLSHQTQTAWNTAFFCSASNKAGLQHSWSNNGPVAGRQCVQITNSGLAGWGTNYYYCLPLQAPYTLSYSETGRISNRACVAFGTGMTGWTSGTYFICAGQTDPYGSLGYLSYQYALPVVNSATPLTGPTTGGVTITISGSNFGTQLSNVAVNFGVTPCPVTSVSQTSIQCTAPAGQFRSSVTVTVAGQVATNTLTFNYDAPVISSVSPSPLATNPSTVAEYVTIVGINFAGGVGTVSIGSSSCSIVSWTNTLIVCSQSGSGVNLNLAVTNAFQQTSTNSVVVSYFAPSLQGATPVSPSTGPTTGGTVLTITGRYFGSSGLVTVGGSICSLTGSGYTDTSIQCSLPQGQGTGLQVRVTVSGQNSNTASFSYNAPSISSVSPGIGVQGTQILIVGTNFGTSGTLSVGGLAATCSTWAHTSVYCTVPANTGLNLPVLITVSGQNSNNDRTFTYRPSVSAIFPSTGPTLGGASVTLTGAGFDGTSTVVHLSTTINTFSFRNSTTLVYSTPPGEGSVTVSATTSSVASTSTATFTYSPPSITSLNPTNGVTSGGTTVTIIGTNFGRPNAQSGSATSVTFGGFAATIISNNHTTIICTNPAGAQSRPVVVTVAGQASASATYLYNAPVLSSRSPGNGPSGGGIRIDIFGNGFGTGGVVSVGVLQTPTVQANDTWAYFLLPAGGVGTQSLSIAPSGNVASNFLTFTYDPPTISSISPTLGSVFPATTLTINGVSLGPSPVATVGGNTCALLTVTDTRITCTVPAGQGAGLAVAVRSGTNTATATQTFSYTAPSCTGLSVSSATTEGGGLLTINGANFGLSGSVSIGPYSCDTSSPLASWSFSQVVCVTPGGQGASLSVLLTVAGQTSSQSASCLFSYAVPSITAISPATGGPTLGGLQITLTGVNFGFSATVQVGGFGQCTLGALPQTHRQYTCTIPAGQGANVGVTIFVGNQNNTVVPGQPTFSYSAPSISSTTPSTLPTAGGTLTITGTNLGTGSGITATLTKGPSVLNAGIGALNGPRTSLTITIPAGTGAGWTLQLSVASQSATTSFSFSLPTVTAVTGCAGGVNPAATYDCATATNTPITISGTNFGTSTAVASVTVGGRNCPVTACADSQIRCTLQALAAGGFALPVVVTIDSQLSSAVSLVSYSGPLITAGTLSLFPGLPNGTPSTVAVANSAVTTNVALSGKFWSALGTTSDSVVIAYGLPGTSFASKPFTCALVASPLVTTSVAGISTLVNGCAISRGVGQNLVFQVSTGVQVSQESVDTISFGAPTILDNSIRVGSVGATKFSSAQGLVSVGDTLFFDVSNCGSNPSLLTVEYGQGGVYNKVCANVVLTTYLGADVLSCVTQEGFGSGYKFRIRALNLQGPESTVVYNYPALPTVTAVGGCTNVASATTQCPTAGGTLITITGTGFGSTSLSARVNGLLCTSVTFISSTSLTCRTPAGAGSPVNVVVTVGSLSSPSAGLLSYAAASITSLQSTSCTQNGASLIDCPRNALDGSSNPVVITVNGVNFGPAPSQVLIGGIACSNVVHDSNTPDSRLTCRLPTGTEVSRSVTFFQRGGVVSLATQTISYAQCAAGSYAASGVITCQPCVAGTYGDQIGLETCKPCVSGRYAPDGGAVSCLLCPPGNFSQLATNANVGPSSCNPCPVGTYGDIPGLPQCLNCEPGKFAGSTGSQSCTLCPAGQAQQNPAASSCVDCDLGRASAAQGTVVCPQCAAGTYAPVTRSLTCLTCGAGTYAAQIGQTACLDCPSGQAGPFAGQGACVACDSGTFSNTTRLSVCAQCGPGTYSIRDTSSQFGPISCRSCDAGRYAPGSGLADCLQCGKGTYTGLTGQSACSLCEPGSYNDALGAIQCTSCAKGKFTSYDGTVECSDCQIGRYSDTLAARDCTPCGAGSYQQAGGKSFCDSCPLGFANSAVGQAACLACDSGTYGAARGLQTCAPCEVGTFSTYQGTPLTTCSACGIGTYGPSQALDACLPCNVGYFGNDTGLSSCDVCPKGTFSQSTGVADCVSCLPGTYAAVEGSIVCQQCPVGTYQTNSGASECVACEAGTYQDTEGKIGCISCETGKFSAPGQGSCSACPSGKYSNDTSGVCVDCEIGRAQPGSGATSCVECGPGSFINAPGQLSCQTCDPGRFAADRGASACTACGAGTAQLRGGQSTCGQCGPGTYTDSVGSIICRPCLQGTYSPDGGVTCLPCDAGSYQNSIGKTACIACAAGTAVATKGQERCDACPAGTFAGGSGNSVCEACAAGYWSPQLSGAVGPVSCNKCDAGKFGPATGQVSCQVCRLGRYSSTEGSTTCDLCPVGAYRDSASQSSSQCDPCPAGTYTNFNGSVSCINCRPGTFTDAPGASVCSDCQPGKYQDKTGQAGCIPCEAGTFTENFGQDVCVTCGVGTAHNDTGRSVCDKCLPGTFQDELTHTGCALCQAGQYNPVPGASVCLLCPHGTVTSTAGNINCTACPRGYFSGNQGGSVCQACSPGYAAALEGSDSCAPCVPGKFSTAAATNCSACPPGYAQPLVARSTCNPCNPGQFATGGNAACEPCGANQAQPNFASAVCLSCQRNAISNDARTTCLCDIGYALQSTTNNSAALGTCVTCPRGAKCIQTGLIYEKLETLPGYWEQNKTFYRCLLQSHCPGGGNSPCGSNREGIICARCVKGYTKDLNGVCRPCTKGGSWVYLLLVILAMLAALILQYYIILRSADQLFAASELEADAKKRTEAGYIVDEDDDWQELQLRHVGELTIYGPPAPRASFVFKLKIALGFAQIVSNLGVSLDIEWPDSFKALVLSFSFTNIDFFQGASVDCVVRTNYFAKLWVFIFGPAAIIAGLCLFYLLPQYIKANQKSSQDDEAHTARKVYRQKFFRLLVFTFFLIYPSVAATIVRVYICRTYLGTPYLVADFSITCTSSIWRTMALLSMPFVALYPLGIPAFFFVMLYRYRTRLHETGIRAELGFLYDAYERKVWFWELVDMAHKLFLVSLIGFVPYIAQLQVGLAVIALYMAALLCFKPYIRKADDRLHILAQAELLLLLLAGHIFRSNITPDPVMEVVMAIALSVVFLLFFVYLILTSINVVKKMLSDNKYVLKIANYFCGAYLARRAELKKIRRGLATKKLRPGEELYDTLSVPPHVRRRDMFVDEKERLKDVKQNPLATLDQNANSDANFDAITGQQLQMQGNMMHFNEYYIRGNGQQLSKEAAKAVQAFNDQPLPAAPQQANVRRRGSTTDAEPGYYGVASGATEGRGSVQPGAAAAGAGGAGAAAGTAGAANPAAATGATPAPLTSQPSRVAVAVPLTIDEDEDLDLAPKKKGFE